MHTHSGHRGPAVHQHQHQHHHNHNHTHTKKSFAAQLLARSSHWETNRYLQAYSVQAVLRAYVRYTGHYQKAAAASALLRTHKNQNQEEDEDGKNVIHDMGMDGASAIASAAKRAKRSYAEIYIHPAVQLRYQLAYMDANDEVTIVKLKRGLTESKGKAVGEVGNLDLNAIDSEPLRILLKEVEKLTVRVNRVRSKDVQDKLQKYVKMCKMLPSMMVKLRMVQDGMTEDEIDDFLPSQYPGYARQGVTKTGQIDTDGGGDKEGQMSKDMDELHLHTATKDAQEAHARRGKVEERATLVRSCEIVSSMREFVKAGDFKQGFELLEIFISPTSSIHTGSPRSERLQGGGLDKNYKNDKKTGNTGCSAPSSGSGNSTGNGNFNNNGNFYSVVHDAARSEFEILTMHICSGFWSSIDGPDSAQLAPGIYLRIYTSLLLLSEQSPAMHKLCTTSIKMIDDSKNNNYTNKTDTAKDARSGSIAGNGNGKQEDQKAYATFIASRRAGKRAERSGQLSLSTPSSHKLADASTSIEIEVGENTNTNQEPTAQSMSMSTSTSKVKKTVKRLPQLEDDDVPENLRPPGYDEHGTEMLMPDDPDSMSQIGPSGFRDTHISAPSESYFCLTSSVLKRDDASQTDGTAILDIVDPMYHKMHGELVNSKEEAQARLRFLDHERMRLREILSLREEQAAAKVQHEEESALGLIVRLWENDSKNLMRALERVENERGNFEIDEKTSRKLEKHALKLHKARLASLHEIAARLADEHELVVEKRKQVAMSKMRLDLGQRKLQELLHCIRQAESNLNHEKYLLQQDKRVIQERAHPELQEYGHIAYAEEKNTHTV